MRSNGTHRKSPIIRTILFAFAGLSFLTYLTYTSTIKPLKEEPDPPTTLDKPIIKYQSSSPEFAIQLLTFASAILLSTSTKSSLVLPEGFPCSSKKAPTALSKLFDPTKLELMLFQKYEIQTVMESELHQNHRYHMHQPAIRFRSFEDYLLEFDKFRSLKPVVVEVNELYERMVPISCEQNQQLGEIIHLLIQCLAQPIHLLAEEIQTMIGPLNAIHISSEKDLQWIQHSREAAKGSSASHMPKAFHPGTPLYISCGDCEDVVSAASRHLNYSALYTKSLPFLPFNSLLLDLLHRHLSQASLRDAVNLLLARDSELFAGHHDCAFSQLVVSERLFLRQRNNYCLDLPPASIAAYESCSREKFFGTSVPDVTCTNIDAIREFLPIAQRSEELHRLPSLFTSVGIANTPFNHMMYLLLGERPLPLIFQYLRLSQSAELVEIKNALRQHFAPKSIEYNMICHALAKIVGIKFNHHQPLRLLIASHNTQIQGAPLVVFYIAKMFREKFGYHVDFFVHPVGRGKLEDWLQSLGIGVVVEKSLAAIDTRPYNAIYLNTIVTWYHWNDTFTNKIYREKCIMYVHESLRDHLFALYPLTPAVMRQVNSLIFVTNRSMQVYNDIISARDPPNNYLIANTLPEGIVMKAQVHSARHRLRQKLGIPSDGVLFVVSGDVYPNRNQVVFMEAAEHLLSLDTSVKPYFMIVGFSEKTPYQLHVRKIAATSVYRERYFLFDKMLHETALEYVAAADVFVSLALLESFGLALLEAMTMGIPIIVAKLDGVPDVIYEEAFDVDPTSPKSVMKAMTKMLDHSTRAQHSIWSHQRSTFFHERFHFVKHLDILRKVAVPS
jgi:glycosyltransferase involved in cell wall biosynthesis